MVHSGGEEALDDCKANDDHEMVEGTHSDHDHTDTCDDHGEGRDGEGAATTTTDLADVDIISLSSFGGMSYRTEEPSQEAFADPLRNRRPEGFGRMPEKAYNDGVLADMSIKEEMAYCNSIRNETALLSEIDTEPSCGATKKPRASFCSWECFSRYAAFFVLVIAIILSIKQPASPLQSLKESNPLVSSPQTPNIGELKVERFRKFIKGPVCMYDVNPDTHRILDFVSNSLSGVPTTLRKSLLSKLLFQQMSYTQFDEDVVTELDSRSLAVSYFSQISVTYDAMTATYSFCIVISGVEFQAAEVVASYEEWTENELLGYEDVNCGLFSCQKKAITAERHKRRPIFKKRFLSLVEQEQLATYLRAQMVQNIQNAQTGSRPMYLGMVLNRASHLLTSGAEPQPTPNQPEAESFGE
eukprot:TRINITY_DN4049_c0_g1_i1.p1 TRINITY_DN4049_c0_g1~~TRINITY_DN4049_c0_g1_i1.p1  ORF type:complete len:413 (+),score=71.90 TRINITY_DN4049_c0_g1_i1:58-1296(+)